MVTHRAESLLQQRWQIASAVEDALDSHDVLDDAEQNHVSAHDSEAPTFTDFGSELVQQRLLANAVDLLADFAEEGEGALWIVLRDVVGD
jgi:hypothetical protein